MRCQLRVMSLTVMATLSVGRSSSRRGGESMGLSRAERMAPGMSSMAGYSFPTTSK